VSDVKAEVHDVAVFEHVVFALKAPFARFFSAAFAA